MHDSELPPRAVWTVRPGGSAGAPGPVLRAHAAATLALAVATWVVAAWLAPQRAAAGPVAAAAFVAGAAVAGALLARHWPADRLGPANVVTLGRAALASLLLVPVLWPATLQAGVGWAVFALAAITLSLDGIDGALARRSGLAGPFGARYDMEVDSVFAGLLSVVALRGGLAGPEVLLLGFMRYGWLGLAVLVPQLAGPLRDSLRRKTVCVIQIGTLVALLSPPVAPPWSGSIALAATVLLAWSFATDALHLLRRR